MATLVARGELAVGDTYIGHSIINSTFNCRVETVVDLNGTRAIIPSIEGRAWITGTSEITFDPTDPWPEGYRLSDTWPMMS